MLRRVESTSRTSSVKPQVGPQIVALVAPSGTLAPIRDDTNGGSFVIDEAPVNAPHADIPGRHSSSFPASALATRKAWSLVMPSIETETVSGLKNTNEPRA